jgi:predicted nucleotidyltransferase
MFAVSMAQRDELQELRREFRIRLVLAFGSKVRGTAHAKSDLDIALLMENGGSLTLELLQRISAIFPGARVDLALLNRADPLLLKEVTAGPILLAGSEEDLQEFRIYSFKRYAEYRPYFQLEAATNARHLSLLHDGRSPGTGREKNRARPPGVGEYPSSRGNACGGVSG